MDKELVIEELDKFLNNVEGSNVKDLLEILMSAYIGIGMDHVKNGSETSEFFDDTIDMMNDIKKEYSK